MVLSLTSFFGTTKSSFSLEDELDILQLYSIVIGFYYYFYKFLLDVAWKFVIEKF